MHRFSGYASEKILTAPAILFRRLLMRHFVIPRRIEHQLSQGVLPIEVRSNQGLGAKLRVALEVISFCDAQGLQPHLRFTYPWSPDQDLFGCLFAMRTPPSADSEFIIIEKKYWLPFHPTVDITLNIVRSNFLVEKYLRVRNHVRAEVDEFCQKHFSNKEILGVHFRGTDKSVEAPVVSYDKCLRNICSYIDRYPETGAIYLSSDENRFINYIATHFDRRPIITRNDFHRSNTHMPVHLNPAIDNRAVIHDALVNCLILARSAALMKTSSYLSAFSKIFNPNLPIIMLNRPRNDWFPEREILKNVLYQPVE